MTDDQIQQHVEDALDWADLSVDASRMDVTVDRGVVTLRGAVDTPSEKLAVERVALRVRGVEAVVNQLAVSSPAEPRPHTGRSRRPAPERDSVPSHPRRKLSPRPSLAFQPHRAAQT